MAVSVKIIVCRVVTPCGLVKELERFAGSCTGDGSTMYGTVQGEILESHDLYWSTQPVAHEQQVASDTVLCCPWEHLK